ncbi:MAG: sensor histidine kinase [Evtepia gabavorous]
MPALLWVAAVSLPCSFCWPRWGVLDRPTGLPAPGTHHRHRRRHQPGLRSVRPGGGASGGNEFSRLAATFNQMFARLEQSFEAETQFTADASHELRTPVSVIKSACEYGETYGETLEEQRETLAMIHRQADKMSQLIDQLLRITRLDQGTELARRERVDLAALAREVCAEGPWPQDRLTLEGGEPVFAQVDRALIARLLQNLIDNGFKYGKPGVGSG